MPEVNWAGNLAYRAAAIHRPRTLDELRSRGVHAAPARARLAALLQRARRRATSSSRSTRCPTRSRSTATRRRSRSNPAVRYGELRRRSPRTAWRCTTWPRCPTSRSPARSRRRRTDRATRSGNLATAVAALELVTSDGELVRVRRGDADFDGPWSRLGALGVVTRITLDVEPAYEVRQDVFEGLAWDDAARGARRGHGRRRQRERVHPLGRRRRPGVGQEPRRPGAQEVRDDLVRARPPRPSTATRSSASTRSTARRSSAVPARGPSACRTSAWASRRATATSCSPSSSCRAPHARRRDRGRPRDRADAVRAARAGHRDPHDGRRRRCG